MPYLLQSDFLPLIQATQLAQLQTNDIILNSVIENVEAEVRCHLVQKYNIDSEMTPLLLWDNALMYTPNQRVYVVSSGINAIYQSLPLYPNFNLYATYNVGDMVFYNGNSWKCLVASIIPTADIQYVTYGNIPNPNVFPSISNPSYWQNLGADIIPAGMPLTDIRWMKADTRNKQLVSYMCDMAIYHLHSRLSPNNIPMLRIERYMGKDTDRSQLGGRLYFPEYCALGWLQGAGEGKITADLPLIQPTQGMRIRSGGNIKNTNTY